MVFINNIKINTNKIVDSKKKLIISDLHLTKELGYEHLNEIKNKVNMDEIDHIIIPGDIFNDVNELSNDTFKNKTLKELSDFADNKQVFVSVGNHDQMTQGENGWEIGNFKLFENAIRQLPNFHLVHNGEKIVCDNIAYSAFSPDFSYYEDHDKKRKDMESPSDYRRKFMEYYNADLFDDDTFNIFLTHEPQSIIKLSSARGTCIQNGTDLVVSGHMHNGLLPKWLHKFAANRGIISPQMQLLPKYAQGNIEINGTNFIINGPVNAMVENSLVNNVIGANASVVEFTKTKKR